MEERGFKSGILVVCWYNKADFSVLDFSSYKARCTLWSDITVFHVRALISG